MKFRTGSSMISVVDVDRHTLTVWRNGKKARVIPVSTGKDGFLTRNGTKVILEKHTLKIMDASTIGISQSDPEYYRMEVPYAMRVTWSGEFVHAAPWSTGEPGPRQRQPRLRRHEHVQRDLAVQPVDRRRRRQGERLAAHARAGQRLHRLERLLERLAGGQRPSGLGRSARRSRLHPPPCRGQ